MLCRTYMATPQHCLGCKQIHDPLRPCPKAKPVVVGVTVCAGGETLAVLAPGEVYQIPVEYVTAVEALAEKRRRKTEAQKRWRKKDAAEREARKEQG